MKFKLLHDVEIMGVVHKSDEIRDIDQTDKIHDGIFEWCYGHGQYWALKIGLDVEIITELKATIAIQQINIRRFELIQRALLHLQNQNGSLLDVNKLEIKETPQHLEFIYKI
jgi:hypothetical protein